jgi:alpha-tubulin suppressor-like RCC1 family protein
MGKVIGWGYNNAGQAANNAGQAANNAGQVDKVEINDIMDIAGGREHSIALRSNSSVIAWGDGMFTDVPESALSNVVSIAAGWYHSLALKYDGTVVGWGHRAVIPQNVPRFIKVAAGEFFSVGITADNEMVVWGHRAPILPDIMKKDIEMVSASKNEIMVLKTTGGVMVCNINGEMYKDIPFNAHSNVKKISASRGRFFVLKNDGSVIYWGKELNHMLKEELKSDVVDISVGDDFLILLKVDNRLVVMGDDWGGQLSVPKLERGDKIKKIAAGNHHGLLLVE